RQVHGNVAGARRDEGDAKRGNSFAKLFETQHRSVEALSSAHHAFGRSQRPWLYTFPYPGQLGNRLTGLPDENFLADVRFRHQPRESVLASCMLTVIAMTPICSQKTVL